MKKLTVFFVCFVFLSQFLCAQVDDVKIPNSSAKTYKLGMKAFELRDYFLAKRYFDALADRGFENQDQQFNYARLMYMLGEYKKSLEIMTTLFREKYNNPLIYYYGSLLNNIQGNKKESRDYALFFLKQKGMKLAYPKEHGHLVNLKLYLDSAVQAEKDTNSSSVYSLIGPVNGSGAEFNPVILNDGILYGSQNMKQVNYYKSSEGRKSKHENTRTIYKAIGANEEFKTTEPFGLDVGNMEISSFAYSLDKRVIYVSGCLYNEDLKKYQCEIYQSKFKENQWTPLEIIEELKAEDASNTHVNVGFDAVKKSPILFFASDRKGGRGGMDIYMSFYNSRTLKYSTPRNLGGLINTTADDITPFYHTPENTLFFSSNGRGGLGGHDIYSTKLKENIFQKVGTLGPEINSPQDDVFFTPGKSMQSGYLVSNRYSENSLINPHCCDDIYFWEMTSKKRQKAIASIKLQAINKKTKEIIPNFSYQVFRIDSSDLSFVENGVGRDTAIVKDLLTKKRYEVEMYAPKYYRQKTMIEIKNDSLYVLEFDLEPINYNPILLPLVEFDFDSFTLTSLARHIIDSLVVPVLRTNPTMRIELSAHTDSRGTDEYNESLSQKRAAAIRFYLIDNKRIVPERLEAKGYGEYVPVAPNENPDGTDNPEGRQRNRRCEFRILTDEYDPY